MSQLTTLSHASYANDELRAKLNEAMSYQNNPQLMRGDMNRHTAAATQKFLATVDSWLKKNQEWEHDLLPFVVAVLLRILIQNAKSGDAAEVVDCIDNKLLKHYRTIADIPCLASHLREWFNQYAGIRPVDTFSVEYLRKQIEILSARILSRSAIHESCALDGCGSSHLNFAALVNDDQAPNRGVAAIARKIQTDQNPFNTTISETLKQSLPRLDQAFQGRRGTKDEQKIFIIFNATFREILRNALKHIDDSAMSVSFRYEMTVMSRSIIDFPYEETYSLLSEHDMDDLVNPISREALLACRKIFSAIDETEQWRVLLLAMVWAENLFIPPSPIAICSSHELALRLHGCVERMTTRGAEEAHTTGFFNNVYIALNLLELLALCSLAEPLNEMLHQQIGQSTKAVFLFVLRADDDLLVEKCYAAMMRVLVILSYKRVTPLAWDSVSIGLAILDNHPIPEGSMEVLVCPTWHPTVQFLWYEPQKLF